MVFEIVPHLFILYCLLLLSMHEQLDETCVSPAQLKVL
jgi:hypothetical protein